MKNYPITDKCTDCGGDFQRSSLIHKFCEDCRFKRQLANVRRAGRKFRKALKHPGEIYQCIDCGDDYVFSAGKTTRCKVCQGQADNKVKRFHEQRNPERAQAQKKESRLRLQMSGNRLKALNRDNETCQMCHAPNSNFVHHIDGNGISTGAPNNDLGNLVTLCNSCHHLLHAEINRALWLNHKEEVLEIYNNVVSTKAESA